MSQATAFFSSPLQSTYIPIQTRDPLWSPQLYRPTSHFKPTSPSPLRTSRNANVMSGPFSKKYEADDTTAKTSPSLTTSDAQPQPLFFLNQTQATELGSNATRASQFQYEARARSSSPSVQLQSHMTANRDSRKKVFLNRLRSKRDDARFERNAEQILRMDWLNERKARENAMAQRVSEHEDMEMQMEDEDLASREVDPMDEGEMSPTEEKEIEELVSYFEEEQMDDNFDDAEEDYEALFMEALSRDQSSKDQDGLHAEFGVDKFDVDMA